LPIRATRYVVTSCGARQEDVLLTGQRPWSRDGWPVAVCNGRILTPGEAGTLYTDSRDYRQVQRVRLAGYRVEAPDATPRGPHPRAAERQGWW
jgi:hypothetical protein